MLLDEPTVHLDLRHQVETMDLLVDLNERDGTTIVAVLHDLHAGRAFLPARPRALTAAGSSPTAPPAEVLDADADPRRLRRRPALSCRLAAA